MRLPSGGKRVSRKLSKAYVGKLSTVESGRLVSLYIIIFLPYDKRGGIAIEIIN